MCIMKDEKRVPEHRQTVVFLSARHRLRAQVSEGCDMAFCSLVSALHVNNVVPRAQASRWTAMRQFVFLRMRPLNTSYVNRTTKAVR